LFYNKWTGGLELCADDQKQQVAARIRSAFHAHKATSGPSCCATKKNSGCATKSTVSWNGVEAVKPQDTITAEFTVKVFRYFDQFALLMILQSVCHTQYWPTDPVSYNGKRI